MMQSVVDFANKGGKVIGVCNGFQILCESGLLPGVLLQNLNQQFVCKNVWLKADVKGNTSGPLKIPIAHGEGRYYADTKVLDDLEHNEQVIFRYCDEKGNVHIDVCPNGAERNIAGIRNKAGNVYGMMPHPERAVSADLGNLDGFRVFELLGMN
jgi:phosphoribosylformylglycinamidine synthase